MQQFYNRKIGKIIVFIFLLFAAGTTNAQVGIGTPTPNASSQLEVSSTTKGFLPPRMTQAQRTAIVNPAPGLMIWCSNCGASGEIQVYNGSSWTNMIGGIPFDSMVIIGSQPWMPRNLNVVTYRNGDTIPQITDPNEWHNSKTGAWCYYNNDPANGAIYGKLYNRSAVIDPRGLAPQGWRIPTIDEWNTLVTGLEPSSANKMREPGDRHWDSPNAGATNESNFTGLPGGLRNQDGIFNSIGSAATFWTADFIEFYYKPYVVNRYAYHLSINGISPIDATIGSVGIDMYGGSVFHPAGENGYSVRCIRQTVKIGKQEWMTRNLDVKNYRNGDAIPFVGIKSIWDTLTSGAWCVYDNSDFYGAKYGVLYNWYAVHDSRGLAPSGYHVATDEEWTMLTDYLGGSSVAGDKIKSKGTSIWNSPNAGATNSSGFTALPGGKREYGVFKQILNVGAWWTNSGINNTNAWYREVNFYDPNIYRWDIEKQNAFSVRCVKD